MKYKLFKRELVLGVIILFLISTIGASNVPGDSKNIENEQIQDIINNQKDSNLEFSGLISEEHMPVQISGTEAHVSAYKRGGQIKRLYGEAFSQGENPEESAEKFLQLNAHIFGIESSDLGDQSLQPIMYLTEIDEYKFTGVNYVQYKDGIRVFQSRLILLVKNKESYPLVHASVDLRNLGGFVPDIGDLNPEEGINNAMKLYPNLVQFRQQELVIWAGIDDMIVKPTLAYSFEGDNGYQNGDSSPEKYLFVADAKTGEILHIENLIIHVDVTGNVQGKVTQDKAADICEEELAEYLMWARVNIGSEVAYADENGDFTISNSGSEPVTVESRLWGQWFRVYNQAGSDTVLSLTVTPPGPANFVHNNLNNDEYKRAEVNGYYQANIVRDFTIKYNPDYPGLDENAFPVKVNINDNCNAYYDYESINFFRAGGGCPNTAFSTIIHHEYGHHLVAMAGSGQGEYGEGMGDVMGVLILDDPGLAYGFFSDCDEPLRNASNDIDYPCDGGIHYCGQVLSGCVWETRNELVITNPDNYTDIISNLAINAMLLHTGSSIDPSITIDYLVLDDDNGNIYDGTPHYEEIATGFGEHNMDAPPLALLGFEFPDGLPEIISPVGGTTVRVIVYNITAHPEPNTGILHFDDGSGWIEYPMTEIESNVYDAVFPGGDCQSQGSYYFSAKTTENDTQVWPTDAPDEVFNVVFAYDMATIFEDDFETDLGWTVEDDPYLTSGTWERGIPAGGGDRGDPPTDYDGSGQCYLTENVYGNSDVDDGITWLISPTIDLIGFENARVDYALWYTNNYGDDPNNDHFKIYVSDDNGANWILADTIGPVTTSGWKELSFMVGDFITLNDQVKVRFEASDLGGGSVVEAGIDTFSITVFECQPTEGPDLDCDGDLTWSNVKVGEKVTTTIIVENIGEPGSQLDWEVIKYPTWGDWTFTPSSGEDLTPEDGPITVQVEVIAPDEPNQEFIGEVKIINSENGFDFEILPVTLQTPKSKVISFLFQRIFQQFPNAFPIIRQLIGL
jgi:Zn-dependent metalloprotease